MHIPEYGTKQARRQMSWHGRQTKICLSGIAKKNPFSKKGKSAVGMAEDCIQHGLYRKQLSFLRFVLNSALICGKMNLQL